MWGTLHAGHLPGVFAQRSGTAVQHGTPVHVTAAPRVKWLADTRAQKSKVVVPTPLGL
jgi:hypothetical protein